MEFASLTHLPILRYLICHVLVYSSFANLPTPVMWSSVHDRFSLNSEYICVDCFKLDCCKLAKLLLRIKKQHTGTKISELERTTVATVAVAVVGTQPTQSPSLPAVAVLAWLLRSVGYRQA